MAEALTETEKLLVKQKFEPLEALANAVANALDLDALGALGETANKYDVYTDDGGEKFKVIEKSEYLCRVCCAPNHALQLHVFNPQEDSKNASMIFDRPCKCGQCCACCDICKQEMTIMDGNSTEIGHVYQPFLGGVFSPTLQVMDRKGDDEPVATIKANAVCCIAGLCCDHTFEIEDADGQNIGKIVKTKPSDLGELATELTSDADVFAIEFNKDVEPNRKASLFGALHLIDYMFFENEGEVNLDIANGQLSFKCCDCYCLGCVCPCSCTLGGGGGGDEGAEPAMDKEPGEDEPFEENPEEEEPAEEEPEEEEPEEEEPEEEEPEEEE